MRRRSIRLTLATLALMTIGASSAFGFWTGGGTAPVGRGVAATVADGATPSASASGGDVRITWASSRLSNAVTVDGYLVKRYDAVSGTPATIGAGCAVTITGVSCTELAAPLGSWRYTVTPVYATNWQGGESARSAAVTIGQPTIGLGAATSFAVLGGSTITSASVSTLGGDVGVSPGTAATGFPPGTIDGTFHSDDGVAAQAQADLHTAYDAAAARTPATPMAGDLGGLTLTPGTYRFDTSIALASGLTLDAQGDPAAVFVFQAGSTLTTAAGSHVDLINGASACNVFWQVGSSATLGASSGLAGTIMAQTSISMGDGVTVNGRALAHNGAVTLINDTITVPPACSGDTTPPSQHRYLMSDVAGNQASYTNADAIIKADSGAPASAISITSPIGASFDNAGQTLYYKGDAAGSFTLVDTVSDAASGPASVVFPAIATTGWAHDVETVSTPTGGPYASTSFSWTANPTTPSATTITATDTAGNVAGPSISFADDTTAPVSGAISYANGVLNTLSVPVTTTAAADAGSGMSPTTAIKRDVAPLTTLTETCATFPGTFATTVTPVAGADTSVATGNCYQYEYVVTDKVGNEATFRSASVAKLDTGGS